MPIANIIFNSETLDAFPLRLEMGQESLLSLPLFNNVLGYPVSALILENEKKSCFTSGLSFKSP